MAQFLPGFLPVASPLTFRGQQLQATSLSYVSSRRSLRNASVVTAVAAKPRSSDKVSKADKPSKVEGLKVASQQLRFPLDKELANTEKFITADAVQIMKFHGSYQQVHREKIKPGTERPYQFMLRLKMPAGEFPASLYRVIDDIATENGNCTLRATTRCAWQIHGILKADLKTVFSGIMNAGGSCVGACGDISRNVMCTPAPIINNLYGHARWVSKMAGELFAPQTGAFSEIWLDGEKAATLEYWKNDIDMDKVREIMTFDNGNGVVFEGKEEPIYGETYLPRKFKIGVTVPGDNSIDVYTQDIGIICVPDDSGRVVGYNIIVGGGLGRTHRKEATFARTGDHLGYVPGPKLWEALKAIVASQRDHGNRSVRANARMKYLVDKLGISSFRALVETYFGERFQPYRELPEWKYEDWLGWHEQGDGRLFLGLFIEHGRIKNEGDFKLRTAIRRIIDAYDFDMVVTPNQNIILKNISHNQKAGIEAILKEHSVKLAEEYDINRRLSMACPALPLCGLATTEAERVMPDIVDRMNNLFKKNDITVPVTMRMTGCPNGCARPYMAEIGFVGNGAKTYQLWLGGSPGQTRLAWTFMEKLKVDNLETELQPIMNMYRQQALEHEPFGDFCNRLGKAEIEAFIKQTAEPIIDESAPIPATAVSATTEAVKIPPSPPAEQDIGKPLPPFKVSVARGAPKITVVDAPITILSTGSLTPVETTPAATAEPSHTQTTPVPTAVAEIEAPASASSASDASAESSSTSSAAPKKAKKAKTAPRPRLSVSSEVMERLKNIAALRDVSASRVADEIIAAYLSGVEDEDVLEEME